MRGSHRLPTTRVGGRDCESDDECALLTFECPLGCYQAVNTKYVAAVQRKARELLDDYKRGSSRCFSECAIARGAQCRNRKCVPISSFTRSDDAGAP